MLHSENNGHLLGTVLETYQGPTALLPVWLFVTSCCRMARGEPMAPGFTILLRGQLYRTVRGRFAEAWTLAVTYGRWR